jgi:glycosyltransferase involved in cell wall biosynthesis
MRREIVHYARRMRAEPVVSVRLTAYRHEAFVAAAIEGVLAQRADFPFELVIGEDESPDRTRAICEEFARRRPEIVRLLPAGPRRGMVGNHLETLRACRGEFVALCDGDDYWIDPAKLQLQVDALRREPRWSLCFHDAWAEYPDGRREPWLLRPFPAGYGGHDLFDDWLITTSSMMFRNPHLADYPRFMEISTHEDLALMVYLVARGEIGYLDRRMSVYRRHPGSIMTTFVGPDFATREIEFLGEVDRWSQGRYAAPIRRRVAGLMRSRALFWAREGRRAQALEEMSSAVRLSRRPAGRVVKDTLRLALALVTPWSVRGETAARPPAG